MQINYIENKEIPERYKITAWSPTEIAAVLIAFKFRSTISIEQLLVHQDFRKHGIGTYLLHGLETWAQENDATKIIAPLPICDASSLVDINGNRQFFKSHGYRTPLGVFVYKNVATLGQASGSYQIQRP